jgi:hypothetical protein
MACVPIDMRSPVGVHENGADLVYSTSGFRAICSAVIARDVP